MPPFALQPSVSITGASPAVSLFTVASLYFGGQATATPQFTPEDILPNRCLALNWDAINASTYPSTLEATKRWNKENQGWGDWFKEKTWGRILGKKSQRQSADDAAEKCFAEMEKTSNPLHTKQLTVPRSITIREMQQNKTIITPTIKIITIPPERSLTQSYATPTETPEGFAVAWVEDLGWIYCQRFDACGAPLAPPFLMTDSPQTNSVYRLDLDTIVVPESDYRLLATWGSVAHNPHQIHRDVFSPNGTSLTGHNTLVAASGDWPCVAALKTTVDPRFVVAYQQYVSSSYDLLFQLYNPDGSKIGDSSLLGKGGSVFCIGTRDSFWFTFSDTGLPPNTGFVKIIDKDGIPIGVVSKINPVDLDFATFSNTAPMSGTNFAVAYGSKNPSPEIPQGIFVQPYYANSSKIGDPIRLTTNLNDIQDLNPNLIRTATGLVTSAYETTTSGTFYSPRVIFMDHEGNPIGEPLIIPFNTQPFPLGIPMQYLTPYPTIVSIGRPAIPQYTQTSLTP